MANSLKTKATNQEQPPWSITARWVFPVDQPPMPGATVLVQGDRIFGVEPAGKVTADVDLGNVALLPGFANVHTHLDLTGLHLRCPPGPDFTAWLRQVIAHRRSQTAEQIAADIRVGLAQSLRHGVTLLGDISAGGASWPFLANAPLRAVVFYELLGLTASRAEQTWHGAAAWLQATSRTETCRPGFSPHAPYSVHASLFDKAASCPPEVPIAIHLAETAAELQLLQEQRGPFVDFLKEVGVWDPQGLVAGLAPLVHAFHRHRPLWVHGNYLDPAIPELPSGTVAYCPRTHAAFGHPPHPWRQLATRGVPLALGTDSLASNPDLSILEEIRFLHQHHPDLAGSWLLFLATHAGAQALDWGEETGTLTPCKSADLVVVELPNHEENDPHRLILEGSGTVQKVLFRGGWVIGG